MLDQNTSTQLKTLLERLESPIELVATLDGSDKSAKIKELVEEIAALSPQVTARFDGNNARAPSFGIAKVGEQPRILRRFTNGARVHFINFGVIANFWLCTKSIG